MSDKSYKKSFSFNFVKQTEENQLPIGDGIPISDQDLAEINRIAPKVLKKEDLFAGLLAAGHNAVDRDEERFKESLLQDLARTLFGKSLLKHHDSKSDPLGRFFASEIKKMSLEAFRAFVGVEMEEIRGTDSPEVLFSKFFIRKDEKNLSDRKDIDSGIFGHASIRFRASAVKFIDDDKGGFAEISGPGEATEVSLVWLGSQQGAGVKDAKEEEDTQKKENNMEKGMEKLKEFLGSIKEIIGEAVTESNVTEKIKSVLAKATDQVKELTTKNTELEKQVKELTPLADYGKAYRDDSEKEYIRCKALMGEVQETPEAQDKVKGFLKNMDMDFILDEVKTLQARVHAKFPDKSQFTKTKDAPKPGETNAKEDPLDNDDK